MADEEIEEPVETNNANKPKATKVLLGVTLASLLASVGFYATLTGIVGLPANSPAEDVVDQPPIQPMPSLAFVEIEPMIVSIPERNPPSHLRFRGHLEVYEGQQSSVQSLMPRVTDVLNGYLRALQPTEITDSKTLIRIRSQMLRRVQLVVGDGRVRDLLISEFVVN